MFNIHYLCIENILQNSFFFKFSQKLISDEIDFTESLIRFKINTLSTKNSQSFDFI